MRLPDVAGPVLMMFQPAFSTPTYDRFLVRWLGAIMTTGRQTITNILPTVRHHANGHVSSDHRVWSQRRRSTWELARLLLTFLLKPVLPPGPVLLAGGLRRSQNAQAPRSSARPAIAMAGARPRALRRIGGGISGSSCRCS
jgi:hypothetical protein